MQTRSLTIDGRNRSHAASATAGALPVLVLIGGCINGFAVRVIDAINAGATGFGVPGVSPFELIAVVAGMILLCRDRAQLAVLTSDARMAFAAAAASAAMIVPSSAASWLAVAGYGLALAWRSRGEVRAASLLFVALAASALWAAVFVKWLVLPITTMEAGIVAAALRLSFPGVIQSANTIQANADHTLVILAQCSAFEGLPRALTGLAGIAMMAGAWSGRRLAACFAVAIGTLVAGAWLRLVLMASSAETYAVVHGPTGSDIYDLFQTLLILAMGFGATRR